jgi:predicted dehydrogenase
MTTETSPRGVGLIGSSPAALFAIERLTLRRDFQTVAVCLNQTTVDEHLVGTSCARYERSQDVIDDPRVEIVYVSAVTDVGDAGGDEAGVSDVDAAIRAGKSVVLASPLTLSAGKLHQLAVTASERNVLATFDEPSLRHQDFLLAKFAIDSQRLGEVRRLHLSIFENELPGESFARGILRDLGSRWCTQLLMLVDSVPCQFHLRRFRESSMSADAGFLAIIDFENGASALIEIQTRSLLGYRSGWLIEGNAGSYRSGRIYAQTADGEIIDEPLSQPTVSSDPFLDSLACALRERVDVVPSLHDAAQVVEVIDRLEQSS